MEIIQKHQSLHALLPHNITRDRGDSKLISIHGVYAYCSQTVGSTAYILFFEDCDFLQYLPFNNSSHDREENIAY